MLWREKSAAFVVAIARPKYDVSMSSTTSLLCNDLELPAHVLIKSSTRVINDPLYLSQYNAVDFDSPLIIQQILLLIETILP